MANHKSSIKRIRQEEKRRLHNRYYGKTMRNAVRKLRATHSKEEALDELQASIVKELEKVSQMTVEQAKQVIIDRYTEEAKIDAVKIAKEIEDKAKDEAEKKARNKIIW